MGLNFRDVLNVLGMYPGDPGPPGGDCAGVVEAVGAGVQGLAPGDAVFGLAPGCLGHSVYAPAGLLVPMPANLSFEAAATTPTVYVTVFTAFQQGRGMGPGTHVLVHAGTGGVGLAAIQVASALGCRVLASAGSPAKRSVLRALGVAGTADSRSTGFADTLAVATAGGGVDVLINSLTSPGECGVAVGWVWIQASLPISLLPHC